MEHLAGHLTAPEVRPFAVAAAMIAVVGCIEMVSMLLGFSASELAGKAVDFDSDADGSLVDALSWMNVRGVPLLVFLMVVLAWFSMAGFALQGAARGVVGPLPSWIAVPAALVVALPFVRWSNGLIARAIPRDESYAVDLSSLVGRVGRVAVGPLDRGPPGRVRVTDEHGNVHTVSAVAAADSPALPQGAPVLLVDRDGSRFVAIAAADDIKSRNVPT
jgi:hypothetical protein